MSNYEQKPDTGSLFANDKREKETDPQAKGSALIGGVEYWVSAWTNTSQKDGKRYQSLRFTAKQPVQERGMAQAKAAIAPPVDDWEEDLIPF
jgi:hypothetical protein